MLASNSHQVFRPKSNENSILPSKNNSMTGHGATSKTPATSSKQRKALGDISNRKQGGGGSNIGTGGGKVLGPKKTPGLRLQIQSQQQQQQRNPFSTKTPKLLSKKKEVTFLPRPTQIKQVASTVNIFPDLGTSGNNNKSTNQRPAQKSVLKNKSNSVVLLNDGQVDDIERPAGRLWVDQQDDDEDSCTSLSLPELNWEAAAKKRRDLRVKWNLEQEAREDESYNKYIEKNFEDDESSTMIGADVWIERTLSFDEDFGDALSFDAPSFCGDISF